jgi:hypothetical protein
LPTPPNVSAPTPPGITDARRVQHRPMADAIRPRRREAYAEAFARGDSYGLLLTLLIVLYVVIAATPHASLWGRWAISMMLGAVMLLTLHTSHVRSRGFHLGVTIVAVAETANFLQALLNERTGTGASFLMFLLVLAAPLGILNRILRHETVGLETILGAICIYVLIAIAFAGLYGWVNEAEPAASSRSTSRPADIDFLYFSFVAITTVSTAISPQARAWGVLVTFKALIGRSSW